MLFVFYRQIKQPVYVPNLYVVRLLAKFVTFLLFLQIIFLDVLLKKFEELWVILEDLKESKSIEIGKHRRNVDHLCLQTFLCVAEYHHGI